MLCTVNQQAAAQVGEDGWIMFAAPAPYRAQVSYIEDGETLYAFTCKVGAQREVQHWLGGNEREIQTGVYFTGQNSKLTFSSIDHSLSPKINFRMFRDDDMVEVISGQGEIKVSPFTMSEFTTAYLGFYKSCQRGYSSGAAPAYNCRVFLNREERTVCKSADLGRVQRATIERYELVSRGLPSIEEKVEVWQRYAAHMDDLAACSNDRTGKCYAASYQKFLAELNKYEVDTAGPAAGLEASLPDAELEAELSRHGFSSARGQGRIDELHFVEAAIGDREFFVVLHDVPVDQDINPVDERLLRAAAILADELTPPPHVTLYHIVKNHPVPATITNRPDEPGIALSKLIVAWKKPDVDTIVTDFAFAFPPTSVQAVLTAAGVRAVEVQDYETRVNEALAQVDQTLEASVIAEEREKAMLASRQGLVYRNRAFWSDIAQAQARKVFEGEQVPPIVGLRFLAGWLAANAASCSASGETASEVDWPDGPALHQLLAGQPEAKLFPEKPVLLVSEHYVDLFSAAAEPALLNNDILARSKQSPALIERMAGPEKAAARLMRRAGCDSATSRQFEMNLVRLLRGDPSLQSSGTRIEQAERESDAPPH
ncbi:hypothetical protein [Allohahella marinimesophila]|uniref:Uncharacterized protein n=1 Tax=Allohahella marinimesophila TaxID=1054972 RepID=A0ABP7NZC7_9GAMM